MGRGKPQDPTLGVGKAQPEVVTDLLESGSDSRAPQIPLGTPEERVLGSLSCMEVRLSVLDTTDNAGCRRRAENRVGAAGGLWPGQKGKGAGRGLRLVTTRTRILGLLGRVAWW